MDKSETTVVFTPERHMSMLESQRALANDSIRRSTQKVDLEEAKLRNGNDALKHSLDSLRYSLISISYDSVLDSPLRYSFDSIDLVRLEEEKQEKEHPKEDSEIALVHALNLFSSSRKDDHTVSNLAETTLEAAIDFQDPNFVEPLDRRIGLSLALVMYFTTNKW